MIEINCEKHAGGKMNLWYLIPMVIIFWIWWVGCGQDELNIKELSKEKD